MTRSRESAMPDAVIAPCQGGAAWSSAPAMTRVGALIAPSAGRRSMAAMAAAQPA